MTTGTPDRPEPIVWRPADDGLGDLEPQQDVIIDLDLPFVDDRLLGVVVRATRRVREVNGRVIFVVVSSAVERLFATTGLTQIGESARSVEDALARLRSE